MRPPRRPGNAFPLGLRAVGLLGLWNPRRRWPRCVVSWKPTVKAGLRPGTVDEPNRPTINRAGFRRNTRPEWSSTFYQRHGGKFVRVRSEGYGPGFGGTGAPVNRGRTAGYDIQCRLPGLGLVRVYRLRSSLLAEGNRFEDYPKKDGNNWEQWEYEINPGSLAVPNSQGDWAQVGTEEKSDTLLRYQCSHAEKETARNRENHVNSGLVTSVTSVPSEKY